MKPETVKRDYRVLKLLEKNPETSQRELAEQLGVSLGKTNYSLGALIEGGLVKAENFRRSINNHGYAYVLTPKAIRQKLAITERFLRFKAEEYESLKAAIASNSEQLG